MELNTDNVISLYTPLAGLAVLAFWVGMLTQKLANVVERLTKVEGNGKDETAMAVQVGILASKMEDMVKTSAKTEREISGIHRALAKLTPMAPNMLTFEQGDG